MPLECSNCKQVFKQSKNLTSHLKNKVCFKDFKCEFCGKFFKTKDSVKSHKSQSCKMNSKKKNKLSKKAESLNVPQVINNNDEKKELQVKEDVKNESLCYISKEELNNIISEMQERMQNQMQEELKKLRSELTLANVNNGEITNNTQNNQITNNTQIINNNNNQTINIVAFGKENFDNLNKNEVFRCLKGGFRYPIYMTTYVNFNKDFPENHNIQLSNIKNDDFKIFDGTKWISVHNDDFYDDVVDRQMIIVNQLKDTNNEIYKLLPDATKRVLDKIECLEKIDPGKYKELKQELRSKVIENRDVVSRTQKMLKKK